jgi:hypothetical protein
MPGRSDRRKGVRADLRTPGYLGRAMERARGKRSKWNLLLFGAAIVALPAVYVLLLHAVMAVRNLILPERAVSLRQFLHADCPGVPPVLFMISPLLAAIPLGLALGNVLVSLVPPARRALNIEAGRAQHAGFRESQRDLLAVSAYCVPVCLALSLAGALSLRCPTL